MAESAARCSLDVGAERDGIRLCYQRPRMLALRWFRPRVVGLPVTGIGDGIRAAGMPFPLSRVVPSPTGQLRRTRPLQEPPRFTSVTLALGLGCPGGSGYAFGSPVEGVPPRIPVHPTDSAYPRVSTPPRRAGVWRRYPCLSLPPLVAPPAAAGAGRGQKRRRAARRMTRGVRCRALIPEIRGLVSQHLDVISADPMTRPFTGRPDLHGGPTRRHSLGRGSRGTRLQAPAPH